jgi:hypothetical protein
MVKHQSTWFAVAIAMALAGCAGSDDGGGDPADTPLAGKIGGATWSFQVGATDAFLSEDGDFFAALYATTYTPCTGPEPTGPHLLMAVPKQPGEYDLSLMRNVTFAVDNDNLISLSGRIVVDTVSATTVTGAVKTRRDDGNSVDGRFTLTVCPDQ